VIIRYLKQVLITRVNFSFLLVELSVTLLFHRETISPVSKFLINQRDSHECVYEYSSISLSLLLLCWYSFEGIYIIMCMKYIYIIFVSTSYYSSRPVMSKIIRCYIASEPPDTWRTDRLNQLLHDCVCVCVKIMQ